MDQVSLISSLTSALKRHYWAAIATFTSVMGGALLYLWLAPPVYESSTRLMVATAKNTSVSDLGRSLSNLDSSSEVNPLATQAELITSDAVLNAALDKVFQGEVSESSDSAPSSIPSTKDIRDNLNVKIIPATNILEVSFQYAEPALTATLLDAVVESAVSNNIEVIREEASAIREFIESNIPEQQARLTENQALERRYRENNRIASLDSQTDRLLDSLALVENEELALLAQLEESAARADLLQQVTGLEQLDSAYEAVRIGQDQELNNLRNRLTEIEAAVIDARARLGDQHPDLLELLDRRESLRQLYAQRLPRLYSIPQNGPTGGAASNQLSQDLLAEYIAISIEREAIIQRVDLLQTTRNQIESRLDQFPELQQYLSTLAREREDATESLKVLNEKLEQARIAEAQLISNIRVLGQADVPTEATAPNPPAVLVIAAVAGAILAGSIILLLEALDNTLHDGGDAKRSLQLPLLGRLPNLPPDALGADHLGDFLDNPALVEPYHSLIKVLESGDRQAVQNGNGSLPGISGNAAAAKSKIFVVSSTYLGEGKSYVATHLAAVAAMLSRRTLIIDADFSQSTQENAFNFPAYPGLADIVDGDDTFLDSVRPANVENLSILTRGRFLARPSMLSEKAAMRQLLDEVSQLYDWVIIDTSPATLATDAVTFSQYTDGLLLVVRPNFMPRQRIRQMISEFRQRGASMLGVVMNEIQGDWDLEELDYADYQRLPAVALSSSNEPAGLPPQA